MLAEFQTYAVPTRLEPSECLFPTLKHVHAQQYVHTAFINMHCAKALSAVAGLQLPREKLPVKFE